MQFIYKNLIRGTFATFISLLLSGCMGTKQDGISVPGKEAAIKNSKTKFFIDRNATYKYEVLLLNELKDDLTNGIILKNGYAPVYKKDIEFIQQNKFSLMFYKGTNIFLPNTHNFLENMRIKRIKNTSLKLNSNVKKHVLLIDKLYTNKKDIIADYLLIAQYLVSNKKYMEKYGYTSFYLDGKALENNKLIIKSLLSLADFSTILEKQLKVRKFVIVNDKMKSDKIIFIENPFFIKKKYIKSIKRNQSDVKIYNSLQRQAGNLGNLGMNYTHYVNNSSSLHNAQVGLSIMALSLIMSSTSDEDFADNWIVNILETKNPQDYSQLLFKTKIDNIGYKFSDTAKIWKSEKVIFFLEQGSPYHQWCEVTKRSSTLPEPSIVNLPLP